MNIIKLGMFHIEIRSGIFEPHFIGLEYLENYVRESKEELSKESRRKKYKVASGGSDVIEKVESTLLAELEEVKDGLLTEIGQKLFDVETRVDERYNREEQHLKKGSLVIALFDELVENEDGVENTKIYALIVKIEQDKFVDVADLNVHFGLPYKKQSHKTCLIAFNDTMAIDSIYVTDANTKIANYWVDDFLSLEEFSRDSINTENVLSSTERYLRNKFEKKSKEYVYYLNQSIDYFKMKTDFIFDSYIDSVFGNANVFEDTPFSNNEIKDSFRSYSLGLTSKKRFDTQFTIDKQINKFRRRKYSLDARNDIELVLKDSIPDLKDRIKVIRIAGIDYLKIKVDNSEAIRAFDREED